MAEQITTVIRAVSEITPKRDEVSTPADQNAFVTSSETTYDEISKQLVSDLNDYRGEANALSIEVSEKALSAEQDAQNAQSIVNSKGAWSGLVGALNIPASVTHTDSVWVLNVNLADVTLSEPAGANTDWTEVSGVTQTELDEKIGKSATAETKIGDLTIGETIAVSSWSYSGTTITINLSLIHNLSVGQYFSVTGLVADTNAPNGSWAVATVVDTDTITFTTVDTPTGTPTVSSAELTHGLLKWDNSIGIDYIDPLAVGANPTAKIYPDGSILGSTDNGSYTRYPNGDLVCGVTANTVADISATDRFGTTSGTMYYRSTSVLFPIVFAFTPYLAGGTSNTSGSVVMPLSSTDSVTTTGFNVTVMHYQSGSTVFTRYITKGRWK